MSRNEPLFTLPDGHIVAFGQGRDTDGFLVNALRLFSADGTEITTEAVLFGAGTPVGAPGANHALLGVVADDGGGFRVLAREGIGDIFLFRMGADGARLSDTVIDTSANDGTVPFLYADARALVPFADGTSLVATRDFGLPFDADGLLGDFSLTGATRFSTSDYDAIPAGDGILAVTQVAPTPGSVSILGQFFTRGGAPVGDEFVISEGLDDVTGHFDVNAVELTDGRIAVAYTSSRDDAGDGDGFESSVFLTILNADGSVAVPEQFVNTDDIAGAQDWINLWPLLDGGLALSYGTETGFTRNDSINVRFFDSSGAQYDAFQQTGVNGRGAENIHVSTTGVVSRFDVETPQLAIHDAPLPGEPGISGGELLLSQAFAGELAEDGETATLADGRVVVVYDHTNLVGHVRMLDPGTGTVSDVEAIDRTGSGGVREMSVAALADGGFAVAWRAGDTPLTETLQAKVYNADGTTRTPEFTVFDGESEYMEAHPTAQGFLVTWINDDGTFDDDGTARFYDADGAALGPAFELHDGFKQESTIDAALLPDGRVVMTWLSDGAEGETAHFRMYGADGAPDGPVQTVSGDVHPFQSVRAAALDSGGFVTLHLDAAAALQLTVFSADGARLEGPNPLDFSGLLTPVSQGNVTSAFEQVRDIETTPDGQVVLAFVTFDGAEETNVSYALAGLDGRVTQSGIATENVLDEQAEVELTRLDGNRVLLSFMDDTNIQFAQQSSINGAVIQGGVIPDAPRTLSGDATANALTGGNGDDTIGGGGGDDTLDGGAGSDLIRGNAGEDSLIGGLGDDLLRGQKNGDLLDGGFGDDNLKGGGGNDTLLGGAGRDFLNGGARKDLVIGGEGSDKLIGRSFDDTLIGGAGNDRLNAGGENDRLEGGAGRDFLKGGTGADVFVFDADFGNDRIRDFDMTEDRLEISAALAAGRDADQLAALSQAANNGFEMDFGDGNVIRLLGLGDDTGLAGQIDIV